jgi:hypothetical protein
LQLPIIRFIILSLTWTTIIAELLEIRSLEGGQMLFELDAVQEDHFYLDQEIQQLCMACQADTSYPRPIFLVKEGEWNQSGLCTGLEELDGLTGYFKGTWACSQMQCHQPHPIAYWPLERINCAGKKNGRHNIVV